jgi:hypothetical protein
MSLIMFYPFAMPWDCVWWHKTIWQKQWSNSDETVMHQWRDSDGTVMPLIWEILCHILSFCNALGVCLVKQDHLTKTVNKQWCHSEQTVIQQWSNNDAYDLSSFMSFWRFWDVVDHILAFHNALEVWLCIYWWHKTIWQKIVIKQWRDSIGTVMQKCWNSDAFDLGSFVSLSRFWDVIHILSFCNALGVW